MSKKWGMPTASLWPWMLTVSKALIRSLQWLLTYQKFDLVLEVGM